MDCPTETPTKRKHPRTKAELEAEINRLEEDILRLRADFENYKKHLDREKAACINLANENLITELLPVLDSFESALATTKDEQTKAGIENIYKQLKKILEDNGLRHIEALGKKLDPYYHEVMLSEDSEKEDGTILEEFVPGYILKDKVIRHSKVKIAKNNKGETNG